MKRYRAAIVGCGRIASIFAEDKKRTGISTHAQAYLANPSTELTAACDLDKKRLQDFGKKWGVAKLYTDFEKMLRHEKVELLSVCTWNASHLGLVETALKHGVKGIICEKPIADSLASADRMIALCRKKRVPLLINYTRRYVKLYEKVGSMIERGELGKIQGISAYYTAGLVNTGTHLFDFLRLFFGDVDWVWADPDTVFGGEDKNVSGYLHFKKGFGCTVTALDVDAYLVFEADIYGARKRLRLSESGASAESWDAVPHPLFSGYKALKPAAAFSGDLGEGLPRLVENLVRAVENKEMPRCSGEDGRANLEIAAAIRLSAEQGGRKLSLPLGKRSVKLVSK